MILQHVIFSDSGLDGTESLYSSTHAGNFPLHLGKGEKIDFFGYFNYFSLDRWCKYLHPENIYLSIGGVGNISVEFWLFSEFGSYMIFKTDLDLPGNRIRIPSHSKGLLGIQLIAKSNSIIKSVDYVSDCSSSDVCIGIDLCTYDREGFVDQKVNAFKRALNIDTEFSECVELFIVDNMSSLPLEKYHSDKVHIFHNENTGGSGGFTRGIIEISSSERFTHVLLMDDDTIIEPESLYRTWAFLKVSYDINPNIIVGGAMLSLDNHTEVVESSASFVESKLIPNKKGVDVSEINGCVEFNKEEPANYNGWWFCVYPTSYANIHNLPMQLFIKMDDVEYGVRSNMPIVTLNGISVWHLDFYKKYSSMNSYYLIRNTLLISKRLGVLNTKLKFLILKKIISEVFCLKYKSVELSLRGIDDYNKGYEWVVNQNSNLNNELKPFTYVFNKLEANSKPIDNWKKHISGSFLLWRLVTLNGFYLDMNRILPIFNVKMENLFGVKRVYLTYGESEYAIEERDLIKSIRLILRGLHLLLRCN